MGEDLVGEGLRTNTEHLFVLSERLGEMAAAGHTVLASGEILPKQHLALPLVGAESAGTTLFAEQEGTSFVSRTVSEGYIVVGALRKPRPFAKRQRIACDAGGIQLGDRVVLQDPESQEETITRPMSNPWSGRLAKQTDRVGH